MLHKFKNTYVYIIALLIFEIIYVFIKILVSYMLFKANILLFEIDFGEVLKGLISELQAIKIYSIWSYYLRYYVGL